MSKLTDKQTEKYSRQIIIEKIGISGQKKILKSSICIVGCGGLGSSAAQYLSMTGVGNIMLIDHDLINLSILAKHKKKEFINKKQQKNIIKSNTSKKKFISMVKKAKKQ